MARAAGSRPHDPWFAGLPVALEDVEPQKDDGVAPDAVLSAVSDAFPSGAVLVSDASLASGWASRFFNVSRAGRSLRTFLARLCH